MSIFGSIMSAIFGGSQTGTQAVQSAGASSGSASSGSAQPTPSASTGTQSASAGTAGASVGTQGGGAGGAKSSVDVAAVLTQRASQKGEKLDWRHSIVDLMKVLDLDSSLSARKALAQELNYTGDTGDSATMNMWLHKQVMAKLAENGGNVPADLRH